MTKQEIRRFWIDGLRNSAKHLRYKVQQMERINAATSPPASIADVIASDARNAHLRFLLHSIIWWSQYHRELTQRVRECPR